MVRTMCFSEYKKKNLIEKSLKIIWIAIISLSQAFNKSGNILTGL